MSIRNHIHNALIFFAYPDPRGSEENQFTPLVDGVNKLIFKRYCLFCLRFQMVI